MHALRKIKEFPYHVYYSFTRGIQNLIRWLPIVWKDRNWDEYYLLKIIEFKLQHMEKFFNSDKAMTLDSQDRAKEMRTVIDALNRFMNDEYLSSLLDKRKIDVNEVFSWNERSFKSNKDNPEYERWTEARKDSEILKEKDKESFFDTMKEKITGWWD